jgi:hypothetical protein
MRYRWFESISLQRRVGCELGAAGWAADFRSEGQRNISMHRIGI